MFALGASIQAREGFVGDASFLSLEMKYCKLSGKCSPLKVLQVTEERSDGHRCEFWMNLCL